jgi:predicted permease
VDSLRVPPERESLRSSVKRELATLRRFLSKLVNLLRPGRAEDELARELESHLAMLEDEYRRRGLPDDEARRAARLALGGVEQTKDRHRDERSFVWLEDARRDAGYGVRLLKRNPIVAATATVSLAVGIGVNTAVFTVANALLFRAPVGIVEPDRLVDIGMTRDFGGFNPGSYPTYLDIRDRATTLDGVFARPMSPRPMSLGLASTTASERVFAQFVTMNYFEVLGAQAARGRYFGRGDSEQSGASPVAVLSHGFWNRRFHGDAAAVGQTIRLNGQPFIIVGVAPEGFQGTAIGAADLWLPLNMLAYGPAIFSNRSSGWLVMGGRLKTGVPLATAAAEVGAIGQALRREYPDQSGAKGLALQPSSPVPGNRTTVALLALLLIGLVSLILLVACANVSGVLLARAAARRQEIAMRLAMGAGRLRLVRQLLMETMILFALGGAGGIVLARVMTTVVMAWLPALPFPIAVTLALDGRVIAYTTVLSLAAAVASGLLPALQGSKADVVASLKDDSGPGGRRLWLRHAFVIVQVAFTMVLILGAGLFVRALEYAGSTNPGFDPDGVELVTLDLSMAGYTDSTGPRFWSELIDRVRQLPGVQAATLARSTPGGFEEMQRGIAATGYTPPDGQRFVAATWNVIEPGYFATLRIPFVAGRDFAATDRPGSAPVAIVNDATARLFWPGQNAIGQQLQQQIGRTATTTLQVVGVVGDIKSSTLIDGLAESFVYVPLQQQYRTGLLYTTDAADA